MHASCISIQAMSAPILCLVALLALATQSVSFYSASFGLRTLQTHHLHTGSRRALSMQPGHGHGAPTAVASSSSAEAPDPLKEYSFVQDELRGYAMKLHTRDQAPREGQQPAQAPISTWEPQLSHYVQFLVDSLYVYEAFDKIVASKPALAAFTHTGLERADALKADFEWLAQYDKSLQIPPCGASGKAYAQFLSALAEKSIPQFMCHYYNHYFAHTAGGRMIGKRLGDKLLGGATLKFYQWEGDVKVCAFARG